MDVHDIIFIILLTGISIAWIHVFRQYVEKRVEQKTRQAIKLYGPAPTTIEGTFVKKAPALVFYSTTNFIKRQNPSFSIPDPESDHFDVIPDMTKSRYSNWKFDYPYNKVKRDSVRLVYNETGVLWEEQMGLDFRKDDWYDDLSDYLNLFYGNESVSNVESQLTKFWKDSKGYSQILHTKHYAFVSNACINVRNGQITFYMKSDMNVNKVLGDYKWKDFYFNPFKVTTSTIPERSLVKKPLHLLVAHPRSVHNAYQFLEGTSMLAHIAMHPEIFPPFKNLLVVANQREQKPDEWNRHALEIMLKMFPAERRPTLLHPYTDNQFNGHNVVCDRLIVGFGNLIQYNTISHLISSHLQTVVRNWEPAGSGSFLGTTLAADFFRASAYRYVHFFPRKELLPGDKLKLTIVRRPTIRLIENHDHFIQRINKLLLDYYIYDDLMLEHLPIHQRIIQFANTDVFFAVHGTGLANMLFMTRDSYLIEAYPPKWYWSCYQRFAKACGVKPVVFKSKGEIGPECKNEEDKSPLCQQKGIRDRNFNMSVADGIKYLWEARLYVLEHKYFRNPITFN